MLNAVGFVGGLDVHEGHGGSPAPGATPAIPVVFVMTNEDFDALHSTKPGKTPKTMKDHP